MNNPENKNVWSGNMPPGTPNSDDHIPRKLPDHKIRGNHPGKSAQLIFRDLEKSNDSRLDSLTSPYDE